MEQFIIILAPDEQQKKVLKELRTLLYGIRQWAIKTLDIVKVTPNVLYGKLIKEHRELTTLVAKEYCFFLLSEIRLMYPEYIKQKEEYDRLKQSKKKEVAKNNVFTRQIKKIDSKICETKFAKNAIFKQGKTIKLSEGFKLNECSIILPQIGEVKCYGKIPKLSAQRIEIERDEDTWTLKIY